MRVDSNEVAISMFVVVRLSRSLELNGKHSVSYGFDAWPDARQICQGSTFSRWRSGEVWTLMPAQLPSSSLCRCSKLPGLSPKALVLP
ncbi:hypothetical protein TNCV_2226391 [Trichonephila clavipes]|nr:hypothetical protein TNCV_2226391 [Trichonephila clavipes]